jgi:hypothetical protein
MHCRSALLLASLWGVAVAQTLPSVTNSAGPLTIVIRSDSHPPADVLNAMEREVESVVSQSSIGVIWASGATGDQVFDRVAVIRLRGHCGADGVLGPPAGADRHTLQPLGQTQVVDGVVLPFADIRCDAVRDLIARDLALEPSYEHDDLFGRALGRVLAHELYHILLHTTNHGKTGLARSVQTSADLLADRDGFAPPDERRLSKASGNEASESFAAGAR